MRALITGAGGFIGSFLLDALRKKKYEIRGLFLSDEDAAEAEKLGAEVFRGDLTKAESLKGICDGVDIVFHLATRVLDWGAMTAFRGVMVGGTENLLYEALDEKLKGNIKRFVYFSSVAALGCGRDVGGLDEDAERVRLGIPYSDTKIEAEDLVRDFCDQYNISYSIVRPANVFGPGSVWVSDILDAFYRGPLPLINGGREPGAFVYVTNLVDGAILAAESDKADNRTYHFRDDYDITWGKYVEKLGSLIGKKPRGNIPFKLAWRLGHMMEALLTPLGIRPTMTRLAAGVMGKNLDVDNSRAKAELNWRSRVDLNDAMAEIESWVKKVYIPGRKKGKKRKK
ncbi:MAG: NAD-dependent epimerase/dehydratase family protein [Deltaproteobacteria bacterium]|uniref:NAD-dependent epimerase/dehydratase family protein n=1 Tax=Candidatus Zymogenus saltonus TaxID=2844893 RepID=A0A9D8KI08_9DELT|nr:NAD-dependent epimerase/dehydratase family protein [Candidatus Zymogenus saltonus]